MAQKAFSIGLVVESMKNEATTTIPEYTFVRLCTTPNSCDIITTRGTVSPYGISQQAINPDQSGPIAISGVSMLKMGSSGYTTMAVTTPTQIIANASGKGVRATTSVTLELGAIGKSTFAASDIIAVKIDNFRAVYRLP